ncbi:MFS transporter [Desulfovibrio psychrotolerans]|nr:MFS transporter [Desulfovibrio psychrotolerans]
METPTSAAVSGSVSSSGPEHPAGLFQLRMGIGVLCLGVLVLTLGFNVLLSVSTLDRLATASLLSGYRAAGEHVALSIERGLRFGKPLAQYAGMVEMLDDLRDGAGNIRSVQVLDVSGTPLYSVATIEGGRDSMPPADSGSGYAAKDDGSPGDGTRTFDRAMLEAARKGAAVDNGEDFLAKADVYRIVIPLQYQGIAGGLALDIDRSHVDSVTDGFSRWAALLLVVACAAVCVTLAGWIWLLTATPEARARLQKSLSLLLLVLIGGTQLAYSLAMVTLFDSFMEHAVREKVDMAARFIKRDFEYIIHKGVDVRSIRGGEALLARIVEAHAEVAGAEMVLPDGTMLASAGDITQGGHIVERSVDGYWPSRFRQREEAMRIRLHVDNAHVAAGVRSLSVDLVTSFVISLLFLMELARLLSMVSVRFTRSMLAAEGDAGQTTRKVTGRAKGRTIGRTAGVTVCTSQALRAAGFLFFLGYDMGISFIPLLARNFKAPLWGFSEQVQAGLPISAEMICAGVALLLAGILSERFGWRMAFALGAVAASAGLIMGWAATSLPALIVARGASGFGFGLVLMAVQLGTLGDEKAGAGLAGVFAGIFSGSICGSAAGAMLAERLGFETVFLVAAVLVPVSILALYVGGGWASGSVPENCPVGKTAKAEKADNAGQDDLSVPAVPHVTPAPGAAGAALAFLLDPRMLFLLAMVGIPASVCLTGFLYYLLPLVLNGAHVSQSDIGRIFMVYGLCFITVGPMLGRLLDRARDKGAFAMLTGVFSGVSLLAAALSLAFLDVMPAGHEAEGAGAVQGMMTPQGIAIIVLSVLLIGVAQCLAAPATILCVTSLGSARRLGREKAASFYRTLERMGQVLGPILFGVALVRMGAAHTLLAVGAGVCLLAILFMVVWRISSRKD